MYLTLKQGKILFWSMIKKIINFGGGNSFFYEKNNSIIIPNIYNVKL